MTGGAPSVFAAKAATTKIPILFVVGDDPADGNLTGINFFAAELAAKRLELLRELVPGAIRIAVLVDPGNATIATSTLRDVAAAARGMGLQIQVLNASAIREIDAAFATLGLRRVARFRARMVLRLAGTFLREGYSLEHYFYVGVTFRGRLFQKGGKR